MKGDKFSAVWVSHTSISDFLECPRAYFLKHVYRDPKTGHKIKITAPALSLGQAVHEVIESLSLLPVEKRFNQPLVSRFEQIWKKVSGEKGGFVNGDVEQQYKNRGLAMLERVTNHPGPLLNLAVKIKMDLPYYWLSEEDNIILCGKVDWLEYIPEVDGVHVIDFKTGKADEKAESLQLPIYALIVQNCQSRRTIKASYWYIDRNDEPTEVTVPDLEEAKTRVLRIARNIKAARKLEKFKCSHETGCFACESYEKVVGGEGRCVGVDEYNADIYFLEKTTEEKIPESEVL